jgi:hypothetical protein
MWRVVVVLAMIASLGMVFALPTAANATTPPANCGTIIIQKVTIPPGDPETFTFKHGTDVLGIIGDGGEIVIPNVPSGVDYVVDEILPDPGWFLHISFDDADSSQSDPDTGVFKLDPCETVTGTFTNIRERPLVNIIECPDYDVPVSTTFVVKAEITNTSDWPLGSEWGPHGVKATLSFSDGVVELKSPATINLHRLDPGETDTAAWMLHCKGPGDETLSIETNFGGYDECDVHQVLEPGLSLEVVSPCEVCVDCSPDNEFPVDVGVTNTGDCPINNVMVTVNKTGDASLKPGQVNYREIATIAGLDTVWFHELAGGAIIYRCTGEGSVAFEATAHGMPVCADTEVTATPVTSTTIQTEVTVKPCVLGLSTEVNPDYTAEVYGAEKYLPACGDTCEFMPPHTGWNSTDYPVWYDVVSYDPADINSQKFMVTAHVKNCSTELKTLDITITPPDHTILASDEPVHVYLLGTSKEVWYDPPFVGPLPNTVTVTGLCNCCEAVVTWILECTGATTGDYDSTTITVVQTNPTGGPWTNEPCNPAGIIQVSKAHLTSTMEAFVTDCTGCPVKVDTVAVNQDFDVRLCITNTGVADAYDVTVDVSALGGTSCAGSAADDFYIGTIPGGESVCVWFSEMLGEICHCDEEVPAQFRVDELKGYDENTCEEIPSDNIVPVCPLTVNQCDIQVEIINPVYCEDHCTGDRFAVKARLSNCGECDFEDVSLCLSWDGDGDVRLVKDFSQCVTLLDAVDDWDVVHPCVDCIDCMTYEVAWEVECTKPGDVTFHVCAMSDADWTGETGPVPHFQIRDINDPPVTVHQKPRPDITVEIISPENLDTFVATGQEFTVTAAIANKTAYRECFSPCVGEEYPVTITDLGLMLHPESGVTILDAPDADFEIAGGETEIVTWTLQCDESGLQMIDAYATAETYDCCAPFEAYSVPLLLWQYPAAHLEVQNINTDKDTVTVCDTFTVSADIVNTGEADATEVSATLSIIPEDSADITEGGYTQYIGTLAGHGQDGTVPVSWTVHCAQPSNTTFTITAAGSDEYGWHKKQECQSTGNFIVEAGCVYVEGLTGTLPDGFPDSDGGNAAAWTAGILVGEASGLIGPFNLDTPISVIIDGTDYTGQLVAMGAVIPDMDFVEHGNQVEQVLRMCHCPDLLDFLERLNLEGVDKDVMVFIGHFTGDWEADLEGLYASPCVSGGLIQVINGNITGASVFFEGGLGVLSFLDGEYCSTMAQEALRAIPEGFIEPASTTVKQVTPAQLVVDISFPADGDQFNKPGGFKVIATVTNIGEETAENVDATLTVDEYATVYDATQPLGDISGGDSESVTWDVTCDAPGFSVFQATATGTGEISGNPLEAFDTVTVKQGEIPAAQLVVDISYPENGATFIEGDEFPVTATITNLGESTAENVDVSIDISDNASEVSGPTGTWPKDIGPTSSAVVSWTLSCDAAGFSVITVTAEGDNSNTAVDPVTIKQIAPPKPYLTVEVSAPGQVIESEDFTVTAVVSNIGNANASGVEADMTASGLVTPLSDDETIGAIVAGSSKVVEFDFTCEGEGGVNVYVEAYGTGTNTAADSAAVQQIALPEDTTAPVVTVNVPNGGETWQGGTQQTITWSATDDVTPQANLNIAISYSSNGGTSWTVETTSTANDGAYKWTVPTISSSQCLVKVTATDDALNAAFDISDNEFTIYTPPEAVYEYDISLAAGWNLISLPLIPDDTDIADVLDGISVPLSVDAVWAYDAATSSWLFYDPDTLVGPLAEMKDGLGYWLDMKVPATLTIYGKPMPEPPWAPPAYDVYEGWNLIGFKSLGAMVHNTYLYNILGDYTVIWGYEGGYFLVFPTPPGTGELETSLGYWIWMTADGTIIPPGL